MVFSRISATVDMSLKDLSSRVPYGLRSRTRVIVHVDLEVLISLVLLNTTFSLINNVELTVISRKITQLIRDFNAIAVGLCKIKKLSIKFLYIYTVDKQTTCPHIKLSIHHINSSM